jgi:outer membrane protein OmpA-like peptidoglycan-associated protein
LTEGATVNLKNIRFEQSTSIFLETSYSDLQKLRDVLKEKSGMRVRLLGHTDNQGSKTENYRLSLSRVEAVKKYLCDAGIAAERIELKAWGPDKPIADNRKEETRQLNRRVEVEILKMK